MTTVETRSAVAQPAAFWLVMQVWGEAYTRSLTEIALPALLSPGNIPALAASARTVLKLYSTDVDLERIQAAPAFKLLQQSVEVHYTRIEDTPGLDKYAAMTAIHRGLVAQAYDEQAALVWLLPDTIWADGSLRTVARVAAQGKRAVMQAGIRVSKSEALPEVRQLLGGRVPATVEARALVRLALAHMHPYYRAWYWDAPQFNRNPANVFWRTGDSGMVVRAFHLHPLMLFPERRVRHFVSTFDDDLPLLACPTYESIYIAADSDEIFHIDLAEDDWCPRIPMLDRRPSAAYLAEWAWGSANEHHRRFARQPIHVHAEPLTSRARVIARRSGLIIAVATALLAVRTLRSRVIDHLFKFRTDWPLELAEGRKVGINLAPAPPVWWQRLVASRPRSRGGIRQRRALMRFHRWALATVAARTLGRNVALRSFELNPAAAKRRGGRRFPRLLKRLLASGLSWSVAQRPLFWYVLFRSTWADQHATGSMVRNRIRKRIRAASRRSINRLAHQPAKARRRFDRWIRDRVRTAKRARRLAKGTRWTRPARLVRRRLGSQATYLARFGRRLPRLTVRTAKVGVRVGCVRPARWLLHRAKRGVHAALVWRKSRADKRAQRHDAPSAPV